MKKKVEERDDFLEKEFDFLRHEPQILKEFTKHTKSLNSPVFGF